MPYSPSAIVAPLDNAGKEEPWWVTKMREVGSLLPQKAARGLTDAYAEIAPFKQRHLPTSRPQRPERRRVPARSSARDTAVEGPYVCFLPRSMSDLFISRYPCPQYPTTYAGSSIPFSRCRVV